MGSTEAASHGSTQPPVPRFPQGLMASQSGTCGSASKKCTEVQERQVCAQSTRKRRLPSTNRTSTSASGKAGAATGRARSDLTWEGTGIAGQDGAKEKGARAAPPFLGSQGHPCRQPAGSPFVCPWRSCSGSCVCPELFICMQLGLPGVGPPWPEGPDRAGAAPWPPLPFTSSPTSVTLGTCHQTSSSPIPAGGQCGFGSQEGAKGLPIGNRWCGGRSPTPTSRISN